MIEVDLICKLQVPGCKQCRTEAEYATSQGHTCGESLPGKFISSCEAFGEIKRSDEAFHRRCHDPVRCQRCKVVLADHVSVPRELTRLCKAGYCTQWYCPDCGATQGSAGPVECPWCGWKGEGRRFSRMRSMYHRRRRYW